MATLLAVAVSAEDLAEWNDRCGAVACPILVGVARDLTSLWCDLYLPWDMLTLIPPPGQSWMMRGRYLNGLAAAYPIARRNTYTRMTSRASWRLT